MDSKDLTIKERKFLKSYIETGNGTEAAMRAFDCDNRAYAATMACEKLKKLKGATRALMHKNGLTEKLIIQRLVEGLSAEKTEFAKDEGEITDSIDCIDFPTRLQYAKVAAKLLGIEPPTKIEHTGDTPVTFQVVYPDEENDSDD